MDNLPDELLMFIASFLEPVDIVNLQLTSRRYLKLGRDNNLWKTICFENSRAEAMRRRHLLFSQNDSPLAELARAMDTLARSDSTMANPNAPSAEMQAHKEQARRKIAIRANWDPSYPGEKLDFYQEYIRRHAPIQMSWLQAANGGYRDKVLHHEACGMGILFNEDQNIADKVIAPLDDGSVGIWNITSEEQGQPAARQGNIVAMSPIGLLTGFGPKFDRETRLTQSKAIMTEIGAVDSVSIDSRQKRGYFAVQDVLNEIDLSTLQVISRTSYPFPVTAVSEARHPTPLTIGTNRTIHLHDPRKPSRLTATSPTSSMDSKCELIGGTPPSSDFRRLFTGDNGHDYSTLSQPGALSILHMPTNRDWDGNGDIWVAGRFTSLLNYDRRYFPRLRGTVHSGARLSCITAVPHPFVPLDLRLTHRDPDRLAMTEAKSIPGHTIMAAGVYKGKGSLELYSLSSDPTRSIISTDSRTVYNHHTFYHNRQTASSSKLLSVAPHGGSIVFSDGDGNIKWVERDGFTPVRHFNINDGRQPSENASRNDSMDPALAATNSNSVEDDIIQKILPMTATSAFSFNESSRQAEQDNLLVWTGDGKLGMVGFGVKPAFDASKFEERAESFKEVEASRQEREYGSEMRRALERQAAELRWMASYGL